MLQTYPSAVAVGEAVATAAAAALREGLAARGRASLVATGGRSPGPVYDALAREDLDWASVVVTLSDERCVPEDAPDSNARLVRERLLQGRAAAARLLPLWPQPDEAAVQALLPFDVVLLGMGEDGHVASLIPGDPDLERNLTDAGLVAPVPAGIGKPPLARTTLTLRALLQSREVFVMIAGETKRQVIEAAQAGADLPVGRLMSQASGNVRVLWSPSHE